jgi:hypothetical protein
MISALVQQFMPESVDLRVSGPGGFAFVQSTPEDIRGQFDFSTNGASESLNRAVTQQQLINLFELASGASQWVEIPTGEIIPMPVLDTYIALKELYEGYGRRNAENLLYRPEIFGQPLSNNLLSSYGLPPIPGLDQLTQNPNTGGMRNRGQRPQTTDPRQIIQNANRVQPIGVGA